LEFVCALDELAVLANFLVVQKFPPCRREGGLIAVGVVVKSEVDGVIFLGCELGASSAGGVGNKTLTAIGAFVLACGSLELASRALVAEETVVHADNLAEVASRALNADSTLGSGGAVGATRAAAVFGAFRDRGLALDFGGFAGRACGALSLRVSCAVLAGRAVIARVLFGIRLEAAGRASEA